MNRFLYFNIIEQKLNFLAFRIKTRGGINLLDLNLHSEDFYLHLFNIIFEWKLKNINSTNSNTACIDLIDTNNKIVIQVSSTATKQKIESALSKNLSNYKGYSFKFISISSNTGKLRTKTFVNPHKLEFSPVKDIFDIEKILQIIKSMGIEQQKKVCEFINKELKNEPDPEKIESNLTTIINILSKEDWNHKILIPEKMPYEIETKILYNQLDTAKILIEDYSIHSSRIDKIYLEFDKQGVNKSISILNGIRTEYLSLETNISPDQCFFLIIEKVIQKIRASSNYVPIPDEELSQCAQILVVDSFIRCKIFKNPIKR